MVARLAPATFLPKPRCVLSPATSKPMRLASFWGCIGQRRLVRHIASTKNWTEEKLRGDLVCARFRVAEFATEPASRGIKFALSCQPTSGSLSKQMA